MPDLQAVPRQELRNADGQTFAYLVSADELHRLQAEVERWRQAADAYRHQRDVYMGELDKMLRTCITIPATQAEMDEAAANDNSDAITAIVGKMLAGDRS
jgi:alkanesulfonate monooxygenase SsuD/methylene tetrahydromethanopterin reductase-like flavin-dependent oxidoreductase (luciferase family)